MGKFCRTGRPRMTVWLLRIACRITSYTHTHTHTTHTHTLRICNTYCFSTTTIVARTHLRVTLHIHCLSYTTLNTTVTAHSLNVFFPVSLHLSMNFVVLDICYFVIVFTLLLPPRSCISESSSCNEFLLASSNSRKFLLPGPAMKYV